MTNARTYPNHKLKYKQVKKSLGSNAIVIFVNSAIFSIGILLILAAGFNFCSVLCVIIVARNLIDSRAFGLTGKFVSLLREL